MHLSIEQLGWGEGLHDRAPPIDLAAAERVRALAYWILLDTLSTRTLAAAVQAVFQRPGVPLVGSEGALVRLLALLERLATVELPALARGLRVETARTSTWMRAPRGGRVDATATLRASMGIAPQQWLVQRVARSVDTAVGMFAAAILREATARIDHLTAIYRKRGFSVPELVSDAGAALRRFLRDHPLGTLDIPPGTSPEVFWPGAARRASELERIASLVRWWRASQDVELHRLQEVLRGEAAALREISADASYEMAIALGLVRALAERLRYEPAAGASAGLRFRGRAGAALLRLGAPHPLGLPGRGLTAALDVEVGAEPVKTLLIEARNCRGAQIWPHLSHLALACEPAGNRAGLLITPEAVPAHSLGRPVTCSAMAVELGGPGVVAHWGHLLAPELACIRPY